jgi:hypothetical protein
LAYLVKESTSAIIPRIAANPKMITQDGNVGATPIVEVNWGAEGIAITLGQNALESGPI